MAKTLFDFLDNEVTTRKGLEQNESAFHKDLVEEYSIV